MVENAEDALETYLESNPKARMEWETTQKLRHDPRITSFGRLLRKTSFDELPQLWNVLCGEMSIVGPRPEVPRYVDLYTPEQRKVLRVRPGLTDPASIEAFDEPAMLAAAADPERCYIEEIMPKKIQAQLAYAEQANFWTDCQVIWATFRRILQS